MLNQYKDDYQVPFKLISRAIYNNKFSHAYIFEGIESVTYSFAKNVVKELNCYCLGNNSDKCDSNCNICYQIDNGNYINIKEIEPDGNWIKKEQLISLKNEFSKKATNSLPLIYIIKKAEKLNSSSANTILKFLEEPDEGIYALLLTENSKNMITTISSRSQIIKFKGNSTNLDRIVNNYSLSEDEVFTALQKIEKLIKEIEMSGFSARVVFEELVNDENFKNNVVLVFDLMIVIYQSSLDRKQNETFNKEITEYILSKNSVVNVALKIEIILAAIKSLEYNANVSMLIDKVLIKLEGECNA